MSSTTSNSNDNNNNNGNDKSNTIIAIVALVVSVIALVGTSLQVVQQYMSSAAGYSNCDETVIGPWHTTKRRQFRLGEMRFRVLFKTPVFFVCPANNTRGPVKDATVWFVRGDPESIKNTLSLSLNEEAQPGRISRLTFRATGFQSVAGTGFVARRRRPQPPVLPSVLHHNHKVTSAADEKGVHTADSEMSTWVRLLQEVHRMERDSSKWQELHITLNPPEKASTFSDHRLCVALQAKKRTWDTMPASINRPYATTTISHLVEMAAMLGIYWKEFDRSTGRYRAEGNGYVLTGSHMADLGIVFMFQICGKSRFEENRIIPADEAKEFAFGLAPTIFRGEGDIRRLTFSTDDTHSMGLLLLGNRNELAETLASLGCNTNTSNCLRNEDMRHGHLFPLAFEITGMLGKTQHIKSSLFRFLPNPTFYHWDKKYFSMRKLLQEYRHQIDKLDSDEEQIGNLKDFAGAVVDSLHAVAAEDFTDRKLMNKLHDKIASCDEFLVNNGRQKVELVLREHIQELLHMVNNEGEYGLPNITERTAGHESPGNAGVSTEATCFDDLMEAPPETRQKTLMNIYFLRLQPPVVSRAERAWIQYMQDNDGHDDDSNNGGAVPRTLQATSIWCTLVFRMLCWLHLHDFSKMDVQMSKSELLGNRLPVYIW